MKIHSLPLILALGSAACAGRTPGPGVALSDKDAPQERHIQLEPMQIQAQPDPLTGLDTFDAGDLLEKGNQLFDQKDFDRAVKVYGRLVEKFPDSSLVATAHYNAGLAYEQLAEFGLAASNYQTIIDKFSSSAHARDAYYRVSLCLSKLGRWREVADNFWRIRQLGNLAVMDELEARVGMGVAMFMQEDYDTAEKELMSMLSFYDSKNKEEFLPASYWVGQARFYLGEIYARRFEQYKVQGGLDARPDTWKEKVGGELEEKCQLLLRAQNNLIRAIRVGHAGWATAAGYRIGSLYEKLYDDMMAVPVPPGLSEEAKEEYVNLLRERIAVLVTKAIQIYERSLEMAERVGEKNEWVERTSQALERMKQLALRSIRASG